MKKLIFTIFIMFVLVMFFVSCGWKVEIVDPREPEESESELLISEEEKTEEESENSGQENSEPEETKEPETEEPEEEKTFPPLSGDYVVLETSGQMIYKVLEFEDKFIVYYGEGNIAAFDIETGEKIYEYFLAGVNEMFAFDMVKNDYKEGFDFSVSMWDRIVYLSSENPEKIEIVFLPEDIAKTVYQKSESYSIYEDKIIWISKEGIQIGDITGENRKILIPTGDILNRIKPIAEKAYDELYFVDDGEPCVFYEVSFICGGEKVVVTSTSEKTFVYWSAALYDIESGEFEWAYNYNEMVNSDYPFADKYVAVGKKWINAETGNYKNFKCWPRSANGIDFFRTGWQTTGFELYHGNFENIEENGKLLLKTDREGADAYIDGITENYVLVHVYEGEEGWDVIARYK